MLKKIALALIALPTVCLLMVEGFGISAGPVAYIAEQKAIFWAAGASVFLYSVLPYAWVLVGATIGVYLLAEYALGSLF